MGAFRSKPKRTNQASSSVMPANSASLGSLMRMLADVELQSCMHFLNSHELLSFARCNRRLRSLGRTKFAWAHTRLHFHASSHTLEPEFLQRLQLYPRLAISYLAMGASHDGLVAWLDALGDRVRYLHVPAFDAFRGPNRTLLDLPSLSQLEELVVRTLEPTPVSFDLINSIAALPNLKRLEITPISSHESEAALAPLAKAPRLTSLCIADTEPGKPSLLPRIAECTSLVQLRLSYPQLHGDTFVRFFASVHMRCLQSLTLRRFHLHAHGYARQPIDGEIRTAFEGMRFLHTLSLSLCNTVDALVSQLHWFPRLEVVKIQSAKAPSTAPSVPALVSLFEATDRVRCFLQYLPTSDLGSLSQAAIDGHRDRYTKDKRLDKFQRRILVMAQSDEFE